MKKNPNDRKVIVITDFDQLTALTDKPVICRFELDGATIELPCKRLSDVVQEEVYALHRKATPPWDKSLGPAGDYNHYAQNYLKARADNANRARALIIYTGCPAIAAKKPGLTDIEAVYGFVRGLLPENILEIIALTIQKGGVDLRQRADFTSTPDSEN